MRKAIARRLEKIEQKALPAHETVVKILAPHGKKEEMNRFEEKCHVEHPIKKLLFIHLVPGTPKATPPSNHRI